MKESNNKRNNRKLVVISPQDLGKLSRAILIDSGIISTIRFEKTVEKLQEESQKIKFLLPEYELANINSKALYFLNELIKSESIEIIKANEANNLDKLFDLIDKKYFISKTSFLTNDSKVRTKWLDQFKKRQHFGSLISLSENGEFLINENKLKREKTPNKKPNKRPNKKFHNEDRFKISQVPERIFIQKIIPFSSIRENSVVYDSNNNPVRILEEQIINSNGVTYATDNPNLDAKIFNLDSLNTMLEEKIKRMLSKDIHHAGLIWPKDILRDELGNFVGVLIPKSAGKPLHLTIFKAHNIEESFPNWNKKDLAECALTILRTIEYLHKHNILMGCINPAAIRIEDKDKVYFLDTDNYQIEGFPSLVYNTTFTPPEYLGKPIYLCSKDDENYAVAVLLFMILMTGKTPYSIDQEESIENTILKGEFPFSYGNSHKGRRSNNMPSMWRFMWSHLTPFKNLFFNTFDKNGEFRGQGNRKDVSYLIGRTIGFNKELENPYDPASLELFPDTFKFSKSETYYTCEFCGKQYPRFFFNRRYFDDYHICNNCIDKRSNVSFVCQACGKEFYYTNEAALYHDQMSKRHDDWKKQKYCPDCKNKIVRCQACGKEIPFYYTRYGRCPDCQNEVYASRSCSDCGHSFDITYREAHYFKENGLDLPKRCPDCRERRKNPKKQKRGWFHW